MSSDEWINVDKRRFFKTVKALKEKGVYRISFISGMDTGKKIELIYHFVENKKLINLRVSLPRKNPKIRSITELYPGSVLYEREIFEMLGVEFENHPQLRKLFLDKESPETPWRKNL
ncbi:MAG: hypothetical protein DRP15_01070 [Candidatus Aenigmatarchaeota archaeon]|nr:MAG: hypothetical protein DRP15_01070 [Candidatus Aenigmarchaeota archaeon]